METLVLENMYEIDVLIFGAAYAAPNRHNTFILISVSINSAKS